MPVLRSPAPAAWVWRAVTRFPSGALHKAHPQGVRAFVSTRRSLGWWDSIKVRLFCCATETRGRAHDFSIDEHMKVCSARILLAPGNQVSGVVRINGRAHKVKRWSRNKVKCSAIRQHQTPILPSSQKLQRALFASSYSTCMHDAE